MNQILVDSLKKHFKLNQFRTGQLEILESVLNKKDVLAVLPTGGGKSLCYQLPALLKNELVIVISPLIALMKDQVRSLHSLGIASGCLHSGQSENEKLEIFRQIQKGESYILYMSPERAEKEGFKNWILKKKVALFAIDEAHCVSQWGHDFREEYQQLSSLKKLRPDVPILALTASATPLVLDDIAKSLALINPQTKVHGFYRQNLYYQVETCAGEDEKMIFINAAIKKNPKGRILIYCGTRKQSQKVAQELSGSIQDVGFYHAGLSPQDRTDIQNQYANGRLRILVATNAFGMGIDQPDVRLVIHFQLPANIDSLYQEMGRAGRDQKPSTCLLLYTKADKGLQNYFIMNSDAPKKIKDSRWRNLEALVNYAEGSECRHAEILAYYKDAQRITHCGHCDSCNPKSELKIIKPHLLEKIKTKLRSKKQKSSDDIELNDDQLLQFEKLKSWRRQKAKELDQPAFVVLGDRSLKELCIKQPQNLVDLKDVYGFGDAKVEKFGWDILAEMKN